MALITMGGLAGCRVDEAARIAARRLDLALLGDTQIAGAIRNEFGEQDARRHSAFRDMLASVVLRFATAHHLLIHSAGAECLAPWFQGRILRVWTTAPEANRAGHLMLDHRLERPAALDLLRQLDRDAKDLRERRFGRRTVSPDQFDLTLNADTLLPEQIADLTVQAAQTMDLGTQGLLSAPEEARQQFAIRLRLARLGITPAGTAELPVKMFAHPSEQVFANLLDFYGIAWEYEPRSFPIHFDDEGRATEAFTPDFYLPEFDLYVELTTMKQSLVTKKNRKVRLLRELYPTINIQVFYQKDFENLIFKYGLTEAPAAV